MKTILLSAIALLPFLVSAQTISINEFYRKYKQSNDENTHLTVPGWVVKLGVGIAKTQAENEEEKKLFNLGKKIGKLRVLAFEDSNPVSKKDLDRLREGVRKERFEDLVMVREEGTHVNLMIREKKEKIKNLLILVSEEDSFTLVSLKTKLKYEEIEEFINKAISEDGAPLEVKL
ncbi:MAG: DUF4252 domain-containing protein [Saprospirales bacterium]|nr:DUF4252 domain-containing protein [Saprospirales bacterium]